MLKSTVMMSQKKLSDDHSVTSGGDGITVAYMLVWLLCIVFLRDTDHGSEVRSVILCSLDLYMLASYIVLKFTKNPILHSNFVS